MAPKIHLPGASGSGPFQVISAWTTAFGALYPEADFSLNSIGSGATQKALWGDIDCDSKPVDAICNSSSNLSKTLWGIGDAPISDHYYEDHASLQLQQFPACAGAVLIVYAKEVTGLMDIGNAPGLNMTYEVVAGIFNATIDFWDHELIQQSNPDVDLPHEPISVVVRSDGSGQTNILTQSLGYHVPTWPEEAIGKQPQWPIQSASQHGVSTLADYSRVQKTCRRLMEHDNTRSAGISSLNLGERRLETTIEVIPMEEDHPETNNPEDTSEGTCNCTAAPPREATTTELMTPRYFEADGKKGVAFALMRLPYAVGYIEYGYYRELQDFLAQGHLSTPSNPEEYTSAGPDTIRATMDGMAHQLDPYTLGVELSRSDNITGGYPASGYAYWYVKTNHTEFDSCYQAWLLCRFIEFAYTDPLARNLADAEGWITPPDSVVQQSLARLRDVQCQTEEGLIISALDYTPEQYVIDYNTIERVRPAAWTLAGIVLATSLLFIVWIYWQKDKRIVKASQPTFLVLICIGTFIMGCGIIPLGVDDSMASVRGCDIACMSWVWLLPIGFTLAFSALFSKVHRLNLLVQSAAQFRRLKVETHDVMVPLCAMMTANVTLLTIWTVVDPFKWKRDMESPFNSVGRCASDGNSWIAFAVLIGAVNFGALVLANLEAYRARGISDEFAETKYIAISMMSMLQSLLLGLPLSFLVHSNPQAQLFTLAGIIFVTSMSLLLLMFLPKMYYIKEHKKRMKEMSESRSSTAAEGIRIFHPMQHGHQRSRISTRDRSSLGDSSLGASSARRSTAVRFANPLPPSLHDSAQKFCNPMSTSMHDSFAYCSNHNPLQDSFAKFHDSFANQAPILEEFACEGCPTSKAGANCTCDRDDISLPELHGMPHMATPRRHHSHDGVAIRKVSLMSRISERQSEDAPSSCFKPSEVSTATVSETDPRASECSLVVASNHCPTSQAEIDCALGTYDEVEESLSSFAEVGEP